jgi:hypothetical protein
MGWLDITLSGSDKAYLGAALGMAAGAALALPTGGMSVGAGAAAGASLGSSFGGMEAQKDEAAKALETAKSDAEKARAESLTKQMGAKQQAESLSLAGLTRTNKTNSTATQAGFVGQNLPTSAGTF